MGLVEEAPIDLAVFGAEQGDAERWIPIATGPPGLLVVILERPGELVMHHHAHIGTVDPHPEGIGGDHHRCRRGEEPLKHPLPLFGGKARMIGLRLHAAAPKGVSNRLDPPSRGRIDQPCPGASADQASEKFGAGTRWGNLHHPPAKIRAVKAQGDANGIVESKLSLNLFPNPFGGGGREGQNGDPEALPEPAEPAVGGTKVMAPESNAVGLVNREKPEGKGLQHPIETGGLQSLGGHEQEPKCPQLGLSEHLAPGLGIEPRVKGGGWNPRSLGPPDLIGHERHERGNDQGHTPKSQGGNLIANTLPTPGGQDPKGIPAGKDRLHKLPLPRTEGGEAQVGLKEGRNGWIHPPELASSGGRLHGDRGGISPCAGRTSG
jgi:hypothetical protein